MEPVNIQPRMYKPVTILSEDELGRIGSEEWEVLTESMIIARCRELSDMGWEPQEIQVDDAQGTLVVKWWVDKNQGAQ